MVEHQGNLPIVLAWSDRNSPHPIKSRTEIKWQESITFLYQFKSTEEKKDENIRYIMLARGMFSSLATEDGRSITITSGFAFILHVR